MAKGMLRADTFTITPFSKDGEAGRAQRDLAEVVRVMAQGPELERELAAATQRVMDDVTEDNLLAQQRALSAQRDHLIRLAELVQPEEHM